MKCVSCGGEVGRKQRFCSYCGAENHAAVMHEEKIAMKKEKNRAIRTILENKQGTVFANKIVTYVLKASGIFVVLSIISCAFLEGTFDEIDYERAERFYIAGEYGKLQSYLESYPSETDRNEYTQIADVYRIYMSYHMRRNEYIEGMEKNAEELEQTLNYLAEDVIKLINPLRVCWDREAFRENQSAFELYAEEVRDFLRAYFEFTEEELESLELEKHEDIYDKKPKVAQRLKSTYYKQKGEWLDE